MMALRMDEFCMNGKTDRRMGGGIDAWITRKGPRV